MERPNSWRCRWSDRKNKVYYVNLDTRESTWIRPPEYVQTKYDLEKVKSWTLKIIKKDHPHIKSKSDETPNSLLKRHPSTERKPPKKSPLPAGTPKKTPQKQSQARKRQKSTKSSPQNLQKTPLNPEKTPPRDFFENNSIHPVTVVTRTPDRTPTKDFGNTPPLDLGAIKVTKTKRRHESNESVDSPTRTAPKKPKSNGDMAKSLDSQTVGVGPGVKDYVEVYSDKRQMYYYYNLKTNKSQWKKPACLQAAETQKAIENIKRRKEKSQTPQPEHRANTPITPTFTAPPGIALVSFDSLEDDINELTQDDNILTTSNLNVNATPFQMSRTVHIDLNVDATPFVPRITAEEEEAPKTEPDLIDTPKLCRKETRLSRRRSPRKITLKIKPRRLSDPVKRKERVSHEKERKSVKDRLSLPDHKRITSDPSQRGLSPSVYDRLGVKRASPGTPWSWNLETHSNVKLLERDLIRLPVRPLPHPDVEIFRFDQVQKLRDLFANMCRNKLDIEEPTEAFNRWLLEQQLSKLPQKDPLLCYSEEKSVSLCREIMQDIPLKCKVSRSHKTSTSAFETFARRMIEVVNTYCSNANEKDNVLQICNKALETNVDNSDTLALISKLRTDCKETTDKHYRPIVDDVCQELNKVCKNSAMKVLAYARKRLLGNEDTVDDFKPPPSPTSTRMVSCKPAEPSTTAVIIPEHIQVKRNRVQCKLVYNTEQMELNITHFRKLQTLYDLSCTDDSDQMLLHSRVWCLNKRYGMLRSSMSSSSSKLSENFGLHAALPTKAFQLLTDKFHVTFECFASPLNCYYKQYCSAFPDIDCYFGSRGSFFDFKPKSGSFQANPPFSEEVMLHMANHMIDLLDETTDPLMFTIFIPDWREPLTPAIPRLSQTIYCQQNILLEHGRHQYITGNQHVNTHYTHYVAVHGTQVYVLQNDAACNEWPVTGDMMDELREAMFSNWF